MLITQDWLLVKLKQPVSVWSSWHCVVSYLCLCMWKVKIKRRYMISVILLLQCTVSPDSPFFFFSFSVCAVAAVWICYSLDALYTTQKNKIPFNLRYQTTIMPLYSPQFFFKKKDYFFAPLSLSFCHTLSWFLSLNCIPLSLSCASILVSLNWISLQLEWNHQSKEYKGSLVFVYMYIHIYILLLWVYLWWWFWIGVFGGGGNKPDSVLCLSAQGHFLSALSVSTIQRWYTSERKKEREKKRVFFS